MNPAPLLRVIILGAVLASAAMAVTVGWTPLVNQPTFNASTAFLLTDGRVLCNEVDASGFAKKTWWLLTPDASGSYVNGTWSQAATSNWNHLYFASGVFADGRVIVCGGEYSDAGSETNKTEIYDPVVNKWTKLQPPTGWSNVGDAPSVVVTDGRLYIGDIFNQRTAFYDPVTNTWAAGPKKQNSQCGEESWTLLADGTVLSVDCFGHPKTEKWVPSLNSWVSCGSTPVDLVLSGSLETGADVLLPDGRVFAIGGPPATALYTRPANPADPGTWVQGPTPPKINGKNIGAEDAPACTLPNGNVLMALGPVTATGGTFSAPTYFFEFDGTTLTRLPDLPTSDRIPYEGRMVCLPTGEALFVNGTKFGFVYANGLAAQQSWKPVVLEVPAIVERGLSYRLKGLQLNGVSTGSAYGDECNVATNYPLVRLIDHHLGTVTYARTFGHSTMGIQTGDQVVSTNFAVPTTLATGVHDVEVAASGIGSDPVSVYVADTKSTASIDVVRGLVPGVAGDVRGLDTVARLRQSDDEYFLVYADPSAHASVPVQVVARSTLRTALPITLALAVETGVSTTRLVQRVELFNWQTNDFEAIDARPATLEDAFVTLIASGDLTRFVDQATGDVAARISFHAPLGTDPHFRVRIDRCAWLYGP